MCVYINKSAEKIDPIIVLDTIHNFENLGLDQPNSIYSWQS